jgi:hypothetical protein
VGVLNGRRTFQPASEELRRRFVKAETALFRVRYDDDDTSERGLFLKSMKFDWSRVGQKLSSEDESLMQYTQVTREEGSALKVELNTLAGKPEDNADFSEFLKVSWCGVLVSPMTDHQISRQDGHVSPTW